MKIQGTGGLAVANDLIGMAKELDLDIGIIDHSKVVSNTDQSKLDSFNLQKRLL